MKAFVNFYSNLNLSDPKRASIKITLTETNTLWLFSYKNAHHVWKRGFRKHHSTIKKTHKNNELIVELVWGLHENPATLQTELSSNVHCEILTLLSGKV